MSAAHRLRALAALGLGTAALALAAATAIAEFPRGLAVLACVVLGLAAARTGLRWTGPGAHEHVRGAAILASNNRYRLGRAVGSGTRPRIDDGLLGITVVGLPRGEGRFVQRSWREWSAPGFEVRCERPVPAGIDGEATQLDPPLRFRIHPGALRARIARRHPGASPSALQPDGAWDGLRALARIAAGRDTRAPARTTRPRRERPRERTAGP